MVNHSSIFYINFGHQYRRNLVMAKNCQKKVRRIRKIKAQLLSLTSESSMHSRCSTLRPTTNNHCLSFHGYCSVSTSSLFQISRDCPNVIFVLCNCGNLGYYINPTTNNVNTVLCMGRCIMCYSEVVKYMKNMPRLKRIYSFNYLHVSIRKWIVFCFIPLLGIIIKNLSLEPIRVSIIASNEWRIAIRSQSKHRPMRKLRQWFSFEAGSIESKLRNAKSYCIREK